MKILHLSFFIWLLSSLPFGESRRGAYAQTYPVQLNTQLVPPYSGYLPDYASPGGEKLHIILLLKDLSKPIYSVRLTLKIDGQGFSMQTKPYFKGVPINIDPGVPTEVSADVLAQLLDSKNLDFTGVNKNDYEQRKVLPEGYYKMCFIAYDYYNPVTIQVSNESCASAWMTLSDPPQLNMPFCGTTLATSTPQQINFSWTPMNQGSPNSAQNTEYVFELWEIRPDGAATNNIVQTLPPVYSVTTDFTMLNYGITETPLNPGMEYAWRVRAKDKNGYDNFKNKGYSTVCTFRYGSKYEGLGDALKLNLQAIPLTARLAKLVWDSVAAYDHYTVNYRKQGWPDWFETTTNNSNTKAYDLEPEKTYEARVQGISSDGYVGPWSNTVVFKTQALAQYACGDAPTGTAPPNTKPLPMAFPGMIVQVGQFEMLVTEIQGANGYYSGLGRISVPFMVTTLNVGFSNIYVNEDRVLVMGQVKAISEGVDKWIQDKTIQAAEDKATYIEGTIDSVTVKGGKVCVYANGSTIPVKCTDAPKPGDALVIRDSDGNEFIINPDGTLTKTNFLKISDDQLEASDSTKVIFKASPNRQYGFDEKQYAAWANDYEIIKPKNNKSYFVPYAGIAEGQSDEVTALVTINNFDPAKLIFKTSGGQEVSANSNSKGQYTVTVPADAQSVYAFYNNKKIGKLNVVSLKPLGRKVVIVPVNGASVNSNIEKDLNAIYKQANVSWSVTTTQNFNFSYDANNNGLDIADATLMTKYSTEMRAIRDAYKKDSTYDKNAYYLFAVNKFNDGATQGYMVRGRAVGFITSGAGANTIAHELGHGAFGLEHTFPAVEKGQTNNLMDYSNNTQLSKTQWNTMHCFAPVFNWFDGEEDAAYIDLRKQLVAFLSETKNAYRQNKLIDISGRYNSYLSSDTIYINGIQYNSIYIKMLSQYGTAFTPKNNITLGTYTLNGVTKKCLDIAGKVKIFAWPESRLDNLKIYLETIIPEKNILLFVNGYRTSAPSLVEYPKGPDEVSQADKNDYWGQIAAEFINRIGTKNVVYADGHHSIITSNHRFGNDVTSQGNFMLSLRSSLRAAGDPYNTGLNMAICFVSPVSGIIELSKDFDCYHQDKCVELSTTKNIDGFNERRINGIKAGNDMLQKLKRGDIPCRKNEKGEIIDTLDIVCHSFGFAYAQGMIEAIKLAKIKLGKYYIIAPENACSGSVTLSDFEEVWQYGSNLGMNKTDPMWEQDGVAPQCTAGNLDNNRIEIPANPGFKKDFVECHLVKNYGWIFNIENLKPGHVNKRY